MKIIIFIILFIIKKENVFQNLKYMDFYILMKMIIHINYVVKIQRELKIINVLKKYQF